VGNGSGVESEWKCLAYALFTKPNCAISLGAHQLANV
jgi:hypothetical protein